MKNYKLLGICLLVLLSASVLICTLSVVCGVQETLPDIIKHTAIKKKENMTVKSLNTFFEDNKADDAAFTVECESTQISSLSVKPVLVNENFFSVCNTKVKGVPITEEMIKSSEKFAVISDRLSLKLFFNSAALGKKFEINGEKYTVSGVYSTKKSFFYNISKDIYDRVYIPYTAYQGYNALSIDEIMYKADSLSCPVMSQLDLSGYEKENFAENKRVLNNFISVSVIFLLFPVLLYILKIWSTALKRFLSFLKEEYKRFYPLEIIKKYPINIAAYMLILLLIPALCIFVFIKAPLQIYIPPKYIPTENIFDIAFYIHTITQTLQSKNTLLLSGDCYYSNIYSNTFNLAFSLTEIFIILLTILLCLLKAKLKNKLNPR